MSPPPQHTDHDIAEALRLDLWNEHRFQITATIDFRIELDQHVNPDGTKVGDEACLTSALIHTRSLLEFYNPRINNRRPDSIWWTTALGFVPADDAWKKSISREWSEVDPWAKPIHIFLAHISWTRRSLHLPIDNEGQRFPLLDLTRGSMALLDRYVDYARANSKLGSEVTDALDSVHQQTRDVWAERRQRAAQEHGIRV